jgi:hypothetical protein
MAKEKPDSKKLIKKIQFSAAQKGNGALNERIPPVLWHSYSPSLNKTFIFKNVAPLKFVISDYPGLFHKKKNPV